jgi:hypothetical protein
VVGIVVEVAAGVAAGIVVGVAAGVAAGIVVGVAAAVMVGVGVMAAGAGGAVTTVQQREAAQLARRISAHHQECRTCQRGGRLTLRPGGLTRVRCETERGLFAQLDRAREAGWPPSS